jgi:hypothetical protein
MVMKKTNPILVIFALSMIVPSAYSGSLDDGITAGDVLSSVLLNNAKAAINDNDSRTTALEETNGEIRDKISALESADSDVNGEVTRLGDNVDLNTVEIDTLGLVDGAFNVRIGVLEGAGNTFADRVTTLETNTFNNSAAVGSLQSADTTIRDRLTDIDGNAGTVNVLRTQLVDADNTIKGRLNAIDGDGVPNTGSVNELVTEDVAIKGRLDDIDGNGNSSAGSVNVLRTQLVDADDTIKGRLNAIDGDGVPNTGSVNDIDNRISTLIGTDSYNFNTPVTDTLAQIRKRVGALDGQSDCGTNLPASACAGSVPTVVGLVGALPRHLVEPFSDPGQGNVSSAVYPVGSTYTNQTTGGVWMATELYAGSPLVYWRRLAVGLRYAVGDIGPGGGWVYRVSADGFSGSEAFKLDVSVVAFGVAPTRYINIYEATDAHLSESNTWALATWGGGAASWCLGRTPPPGLGGGVSGGWFLPSSLEMGIMLAALGPLTVPVGVDALRTALYQTSSMVASSYVQVRVVDVVFSSGGVLSYSHDVASSTGTYRLRCARRF